jgi:hypothetical protein
MKWSAPLLGALVMVGGWAHPSSAETGSGRPDVVGSWTAPFEEGGSETPRCVPSSEGDPDSFVVCKPVAQAVAVLPDGRVFYYNGLEGTENAEKGPSPAGKTAPAARDSQVRILDLRHGTPEFTIPTPAPSTEPNRDYYSNGPMDNPFGVAGVPGRPGDGPVGSVAGMAGLPERYPTAAPDDKEGNDADWFCSDLISLPDGRVMVAGGSDWYLEPKVMDRNDGDPTDLGGTELDGLRGSTLFDPETNTWRSGARMKYYRWYPTMVGLPDGKVFVASGVTKLIKSTQGGNVRRTETYDPVADKWTENYTGPASENSLPLYARLVLAPNGKIFYGTSGQMWSPFGQGADEALYGLQQFFNLQTKEWEVIGPAPLGTSDSAFMLPLTLKAPYDKMDILKFGGSVGPPPGSWVATPLSTLTTIDAAGNVTNKMTGNLNHARWFASGVLLPDGKVLAVGGADKDHSIDPSSEIAVRVPELYDPATGTWADVASNARDRTYHNSAVLLPDMRVLFGGHTPLPPHYGGPNQDTGGPFANNDKDSSFEVWSPPYLFRGARPRITRAPAGLAYGERFTVGTPQAGEIESVLLIKSPSPQHVIDPDQRTLELKVAATGNGTLEVEAPPNGVAAPPGYYYLVVNRKTDQGPVPSVARMVHVGTTSDSSEAPQPFPDDATTPAGGTATPDADTSQAATTMQQAGAAAQSAPAPVAGPAVTATDVAVSAYRHLSARPAAATRPVPSAPLTTGVAMAVTIALLTGRHRRRRPDLAG